MFLSQSDSDTRRRVEKSRTVTRTLTTLLPLLSFYIYTPPSVCEECVGCCTCGTTSPVPPSSCSSVSGDCDELRLAHTLHSFLHLCFQGKPEYASSSKALFVFIPFFSLLSVFSVLHFCLPQPSISIIHSATLQHWVLLLSCLLCTFTVQ